MPCRFRPYAELATMSIGVTGIGVWLAYQFDIRLLQTTTPIVRTLHVGFIEEAFVPTIISGVTVSGLELVLTLEYL